MRALVLFAVLSTVIAQAEKAKISSEDIAEMGKAAIEQSKKDAGYVKLLDAKERTCTVERGYTCGKDGCYANNGPLVIHLNFASSTAKVCGSNSKCETYKLSSRTNILEAIITLSGGPASDYSIHVGKKDLNFAVVFPFHLSITSHFGSCR